MTEITMDKIVALAKRRGFIYPGSELYGGLANTYDYGPMGAELLRNIRNLWWKIFVEKRDDIVGLDASVISHQKVWEASGHTAGFADAMIDCKHCKLRIRADHLVEDWISLNKDEEGKVLETAHISKDGLMKAFATGKVEGWTTVQFDEFIAAFEILCPTCAVKPSQWTNVRKFNLLFPVHLGIIEGDQDMAYLRGETAQTIFVNFSNVINSSRVRLPFGIAQLGKSFRNEITPGNSVFRTLEFEQGEIEYFFDAETSDWNTLFEDWKKYMWQFVVNMLGIDEAKLRWRSHTDEERSFYSTRTEDLEYEFPFGFKELWGLAYRTNYDLSRHEKFSGKELKILDPSSNKKILPHVIEPAVGINRLLLMALIDAYTEEGDRVLLKLDPKLAPVKVAVFPLLANKPELVEKARSVYEQLKTTIDGKVAWDDRGNIGKRYLSQDEVGTPFCVTVDFDTLTDRAVTVRDRDTAAQERIPISDLEKYLQTMLLTSK